MKNYFVLIAAVAAMTAISCNKNLDIDDVKDSADGTPIQITVGNPEACVDETETKVSSFRTVGQPKWDANDSFQMFSHNASKQLLTDWKYFITSEGSVTQGNSNASFSGYIPDGFATATGGDSFNCVVTNPFNASYQLQYEASKTRYYFYCNIPAEQDGTGLKYSIFGSTAIYDETNKSFSSFNFNFKSALCALTLPEGSNVVKIEIELSYKDEASTWASQNLASSGSKQDLKYIANSTFDFAGAGGSKIITIYNNGEVLPEGSKPVYFACVRTQNKFGGCVLTFKFTNNEGKVATKTADLTGKTISNGNKLNQFGTVTFNEGDFVAVQ